MNRRWALASLTAGAAVAAMGAGACRAGRPGSAARDLSLAREIDAAIERAFALDLTAGLGVAVYSREGVHARGFGLTDVQTRERASADTAFYIASSTKSMTALAFAWLEARGILKLEATLAEFSPASPLPAATRPDEVRLRDLFTHVSGIANEPIEYRFADSGQHDPETLWRLLAVSAPNSAAPFGRFQYTNVGYNIATILSDRRLGTRWKELLRRDIFDPAGMTRTSASMSHARAAGWSIARPHRLARSGVRERSYLEKTDTTMHSAGGVVMSARDALRWLELCVEDGRVGGRSVLPAEVVKATRLPFASVGVEFEGYRREHYGLGWYLGPYRDARMLHHFGGFSGSRAHVSYLPDQGIGVAAFTNDSTVGLRLINAIANFVYDRAGGYADAGPRLDLALEDAARRYKDAAARVVATHASRANLSFLLTRPPTAYAGEYENPHWGRIRIAAEGNRLRVSCGVLRAYAEPADKPDAVWVELQPGDGTELQFEGDGVAPASLKLEGRRYHRL